MMCQEDYLARIMEFLTQVTIKVMAMKTASAWEVEDDVLRGLPC
jgi:hypothetical protein